MALSQKLFLIFFISWLNPLFIYAATTKPIDIGQLTDIYSLKNTNEHFYKFNLPAKTVVSIFLNGLDVGYSLELLDNQLRLIDQFTQVDIYHSQYLLRELTANQYFIHIIPLPPFQSHLSQKYTITVIPDNAPGLIIVAAHNSPAKGKPHYTASGIQDEKTIKQAIDQLAKQKTGAILLRPGLFTISDNIPTTLNQLIFIGTGWQTILKIADHAQFSHAGLLRSRFNDNDSNKLYPIFSNQHFMHFSVDGNRQTSPFFKNSLANFGTYIDSLFEDIRVHDFPRYGFDPHGNFMGTIKTKRLIIQDCLADHNTLDGLVCDSCEDSLIQWNFFEANGRHGINLVTNSSHNLVHENVSINNGVNGITIQPGGRKFDFSNSNIIKKNLFKMNGQSGIHLSLGIDNKLLDNQLNQNQHHAIHLLGASKTYIANNYLNDNGKINIYIANHAEQGSTYNMIKNNILIASPIFTEIGISENTLLDDYNFIQENKLFNFKQAICLRGKHSQAKDNT